MSTFALHNVASSFSQMENRPKLYATIAFAAGILVCLGYKDLYPDLERRFRRRYGMRKTLPTKEWSGYGHIDLEDHESGVNSEESKR